MVSEVSICPRAENKPIFLLNVIMRVMVLCKRWNMVVHARNIHLGLDVVYSDYLVGNICQI